MWSSYVHVSGDLRGFRGYLLGVCACEFIRACVHTCVCPCVLARWDLQ